MTIPLHITTGVDGSCFALLCCWPTAATPYLCRHYYCCSFAHLPLLLPIKFVTLTTHVYCVPAIPIPVATHSPYNIKCSILYSKDRGRIRVTDIKKFKKELITAACLPSVSILMSTHKHHIDWWIRWSKRNLWIGRANHQQRLIAAIGEPDGTPVSFRVLFHNYSTSILHTEVPLPTDTIIPCKWP